MQGIVNWVMIFLAGESEGGGWIARNKEAIIIGIAITVIFGVIPSIIANIITKERRKKLKNCFIKSNEKPSKIVPMDVFGEMRVRADKGFNSAFYVMRPEYDERLLNHINNGKNVLIVGEPLSGKTRLAYNTIKALESYRIWIPKQTNYDNSIFPYLKSKKGIVIFDDMDAFTSEQSLPGLIKELVAKGFIIIGTCKKGVELETLDGFFTKNNLRVFHETIEIERMEDITDVKDKAEREGVKINEKQFNGTIGSLFYPLETMKARFEQYKEDDGKKCILRSLKKLNMAGIYAGRNSYSIERVKKVCEDAGMEKGKHEWDAMLADLQKDGFIRRTGESGAEIDDVYFQRLEKVGEIVSFSFEMGLDDVLEEMIEVFRDDAYAISLLGYKAVAFSSIYHQVRINRIAIKALELALKFYTNDPYNYALTQNNLGLAYSDLSLIEDKAGNCKRAIVAYEEALKVYNIEEFPYQYAMTQNNLGNAYQGLSLIEDKGGNCKRAIGAYEEALRFYNIEEFPYQYAGTQNNLGAAYAELSLIEDKGDNCKKAIVAYEEALKVRTIEEFPYDYAMTQNNLGTAYGELSLIEDKGGNCKRAIVAYEEALKVRTIEEFPYDYAMTQNNIGVAYETLADEEDRRENLDRAIRAYDEALKVCKIEEFPYDYAMTQNNLGVAYRNLSEAEDKGGNCKRAIVAYEEALKVYNIEEFPYDYATTQNNLGAAYQELSNIEDKGGNCKRAIDAFEEALKVYKIEEFPYYYAQTQNNLGNAYQILADEEDRRENLDRAIRAYDEALKIWTADEFPYYYEIATRNRERAVGKLGE